MKSKTLLSAIAAAALTIGMGSAQASISFQFNPLGGGAGAGVINNAGILDQAPGSTLATNAVVGAGAPLAVGTVITDYYQANLSAVQTSTSANLFANGDFGRFFTFVASFTEVVVSSSGTPGVSTTNNFQILGGTFKMCAQAALGDNLAGTGFSCAGNGILSGTITGGFATQTGFLTGLSNLDQAGPTNDWPGVLSVTSAGAATLFATINFVDSAYFPDLDQGASVEVATVNSSLITPFNQVDPSRRFSSDTIANGDLAANVGGINGISGPDFLFQSDANASFDRIAIPEPGSLALAGLALAGLALIRRRRSV
jgi:hypothetical protein